jgi:rare lipoprotein A
LKRLLLICLSACVLTACANMEVSLRYPGTAAATFRVPVSLPGNYSEAGIASFYADKYQGRLTANGERFNMYEMTAAHKSLPFDTRVRVINVSNGRSVLVRINDRGPFIEGRIIDLSYSAFARIADHRQGLADVVLEIL